MAETFPLRFVVVVFSDSVYRPIDRDIISLETNAFQFIQWVQLFILLESNSVCRAIYFTGSSTI